MSKFAGHDVFVTWHIPSEEYNEEMSQKSVVVCMQICLVSFELLYLHFKVPLGVQLKNKTKLKEMSEILLGLNAYVPVQEDLQTINIPGNTLSNPETKLSPRLLFGDQLTAVRARGAAALRIWHKIALDHLEGFVPAASDWHARLCLVTVRQILP